MAGLNFASGILYGGVDQNAQLYNFKYYRHLFNFYPFESYTPLIAACIRSYRELAKLLIVNNVCDIDAVDRYGDTALMHACNNKLDDVAQLLIRDKANVNTKNSIGNTALLIACMREIPHTAGLLIDAGAEVDVYSSGGDTPLSIACFQDNAALALQLIDNDADVNTVNDIGNTPLINACDNSMKTVIKRLVENGAKIDVANNWGTTPLSLTIKHKMTDLALKFVKKTTIDNNEVGWACLAGACLNKMTKVVEAIIDKNVNVDIMSTDGNYLLHDACKNKSDDIVELLCEAKANINRQDKEGKTALHIACEKGCPIIVTTLLVYDSDPNVIDNKKSSPLHLASSNNSIVLHLLISKANPNIQNKDGDTVLHMACRDNPAQVADLLDFGADVNIRRNNIGTPLYIAMSHGQEKIASCLLDNQADISLEPSILWTACYKNMPQLAQRLIKIGGDVNYRHNKQTPLELACKIPHQGLIIDLIKANADMSVISDQQIAQLPANIQHIFNVNKSGAPFNYSDIKWYSPSKINTIITIIMVNQNNPIFYLPIELLEIIFSNI